MIVVGALAFLSMVSMVNIGMHRSEAAECERWQEQAHEMAGWYSNQWMKDQCEYQGVPLPR